MIAAAPRAAGPDRPTAWARRRVWNGASPRPGSTWTRWISSGVAAATASMSIPPDALAIMTGRPADRSTSTPRYSSFAMSRASSINRRPTTRPAGPVWGVTRVIPSMSPAIRSASAASAATLTPPPLPRPPAWICALTTTRPPRRRATAPASRAENTASPRGTATPCPASSAFAWYSWIFTMDYSPRMSTSSFTAAADLSSAACSPGSRAISITCSAPPAPSFTGTPTNRSRTPYSPCR